MKNFCFISSLFSVNAALAANPADTTINPLVADILATLASICSQATSAEITTLTALKVTVSETANEVQAKLTEVTIEIAGNTKFAFLLNYSPSHFIFDIPLVITARGKNVPTTEPTTTTSGAATTTAEDAATTAGDTSTTTEATITTSGATSTTAGDAITTEGAASTTSGAASTTAGDTTTTAGGSTAGATTAATTAAATAGATTAGWSVDTMNVLVRDWVV